MPLFLRRIRSESVQPDGAEYYAIHSGSLRLGIINRHVTGGALNGTWFWTLNFIYLPADLRPYHCGGFATREEAMAAFRTKWAAWLEAAQLAEREIVPETGTDEATIR